MDATHTAKSAAGKRFLGMRTRTILDSLYSYLFLTPNFIGFLLFTSLPVLASFVLAFTRWDILTPIEWVGIDNFVKLVSFQGLYTTEWTLLMAASIIVLFPVLIVFIVGQRFFVEGIKLGAVKG